MKFSEMVKEARGLLEDKGRVSYRMLRLEFTLDDKQLDVLKEELIDIEEVATAKDDKMLVWTGGEIAQETTSQVTAPSATVPLLLGQFTQHLVAGLFETQDQGRIELKELSLPLTLFRVTAEGTARSRFEVAVRHGLMPLVGRELEAGFLA